MRINTSMSSKGGLSIKGETTAVGLTINANDLAFAQCVVEAMELSGCKHRLNAPLTIGHQINLDKHRRHRKWRKPEGVERLAVHVVVHTDKKLNAEELEIVRGFARACRAKANDGSLVHEGVEPEEVVPLKVIVHTMDNTEEMDVDVE